MNRTVEAKLLRVALVAGGAFALLLGIVGGGDQLGASEQLGALLPFLAVALAAAVLIASRSSMDRFVERSTHHREVTPYSALADAAQRLRAGSVEEALPGLAQVLAEGTGATRAGVWLAVGDRLVAAATYPPSPVPVGGDPPESAENLGVLLDRSGTGHVVPVLDGSLLRAALVIDKPGIAITPADQLLMRDVANGARLLLRGVALNAELTERVRHADDLAAQLKASQQRLTRARDVERRRLLTELSRATTGGLTALRAQVVSVQDALDDPAPDPELACDALAEARTELDELLARFRIIARGVYPAVLRGQGPLAALEELVVDLPRSVRLGGGLGGRLAWEIESGIYYAAAAVINALATKPASQDLQVWLGHADGRVTVLVEDRAPTVEVGRLQAVLAADVERLSALGGDLEILPSDDPDARASPRSTRAVRLLAWLPERLEPLTDGGPDLPRSS